MRRLRFQCSKLSGGLTAASLLQVLFLLAAAYPRAAESQQIQPEFKEQTCRIEAAGPDSIFALGLRYDENAQAVFDRVRRVNKSFTFDNINVGLRPQSSELYAYWRPQWNYLYLFGYSNECTVSEGTLALDEGDKSKETKDLVSYQNVFDGCCMVYMLYRARVTSTPLTAVVGPLSDDLRNAGYIYGWHGAKDCSKPMEREPDFIQTMVPKPRQFGLNVAPDREIVGWFLAEDLVGRKALKMNPSHSGVLKANCKKLPHSFEKRPPPKPFPAFDDLPPFPKMLPLKPFVKKNEFVWPHKEPISQ